VVAIRNFLAKCLAPGAVHWKDWENSFWLFW